MARSGIPQTLRVSAAILGVALVVRPCVVSYPRKLWAKSPQSDSQLFAFERDGRVGFIDPAGRIVIQPTIEASIDNVGDFFDGFARVDTEGYITESGKWAFRGNYWWLRDFSGGFARATVDHPTEKYKHLELLLDRFGAVIGKIPAFRTYDFSEGLMIYEAEGKPGIRKLFGPLPHIYRDFPGLKGFLDPQGNVAIPASFADVGPFQGGLARATLDGYCRRVTGDNYEEGSPTSGFPGDCGGAPEDATAICMVGFIDRKGAFAISPTFESAQDFHDDLAAVRVDGRWGFIDRAGKFAIPPRFQQTQSFSQGLAAVRIGRNWGFIDPRGALVIPAQFDSVEPFSQSLALATSGRQSFFIDRAGRVVIQGAFREATSFAHGLAAVLVAENRVAYIDRTGRTVFEYTRGKLR